MATAVASNTSTSTSNNPHPPPSSAAADLSVAKDSAPQTTNGKGQQADAAPTAPTAAPAAKPDAANSNSTGKDKPSNAPLAPPPRPAQSGAQNSSDYFGGGHNKTHFSLEPNPFEQSFGQPSSEDRKPGAAAGLAQQVLPSVSSLTSPAPLGPGATPDWQNSLRVGPLSPAMLAGPTGSNGGDYFDSSFRQSFPTPNESSMRSTGLTPGGPSMFPAPSPNSQALFNSIQNGGATPGTLDFHRTAMNAKARTLTDPPAAGAGAAAAAAGMHGINKADYQPAQQQQQSQQQSQQGMPFNNNSESDAVNSLYMLANNGQRNPNQFSIPPSQPQQAAGAGAASQQQRAAAGPGQPPAAAAAPSTHRANQQSVGGMSASTGDGVEGYGSDASVDAKPAGGKKGGKKASKAASAAAAAAAAAGGAGGRRKLESNPPSAKAPASKKAKGNSGMALEMSPDDDMDDDDEDSMMNNDIGPNGKKLTDEEKRKNFLERNRVAALKCRQRKKQWLANLQAKVEIFTTENDALNTQCAQMREEIQNLKALLIQHKDCPVSHSQGIAGNRLLGLLGIPDNYADNHYGMNMRGDNMGQVGR